MGTTISNVLMSYDVNKLHVTVKAALEKLGYLDHFNNNNNDPKTYFLPNTTLWHPAKSTNQAMIDLKTVCQNLQVTLEKAVAVNATNFVGL